MSSDTQTKMTGTKTPVMRHPLEVKDLVDWGVIPTMIEGESRTSGKLLYKGPGGSPESGIWVCTPGYWNCHVTADEFCHFLAGRCTFTPEAASMPRSSTPARIIMPSRVRAKSSHRPTPMTMEASSTKMR